MYFYGYSAGLSSSGSLGSTDPQAWDEDMNFVKIVSASEIKVSDSNGNIMDDYRNIEYGSPCTVSWTSGTYYNEVESVANNRYYEYVSGEVGGYRDDYDYILEGEVTRDGYAIYDLSEVTPGLYQIYAGGLIVIE